MNIERTISSISPDKCHMVVKGFFGNVKGEVKAFSSGDKMWYRVFTKNDKFIGQATDFYMACDMLLTEMKIIKTNFV